jgi:hypothetical protein
VKVACPSSNIADRRAGRSQCTCKENVLSLCYKRYGVAMGHRRRIHVIYIDQRLPEAGSRACMPLTSTLQCPPSRRYISVRQKHIMLLHSYVELPPQCPRDCKLCVKADGEPGLLCQTLYHNPGNPQSK